MPSVNTNDWEMNANFKVEVMEQPLLHNEIGIQMSFNLLLYWSLVFLSAHCRRFGIWYAHKMIMVYLITAIVDPTICYADRGWTHFERSCSELIKPSKAGGNFFMWEMTIEISDKAGSQAGSKACNHCQSRGSKFGVLEINFPFGSCQGKYPKRQLPSETTQEFLI